MRPLDLLAVALLRLLRAFASHLDARRLRRLGRGLATALRLDRKRLAITRSNVERAFPDVDAWEREKIVVGSYENLGITLAELLAAPSLTRSALMKRVDIPGIEVVRERSDRREPSILLSGHYGNWEYLAMAAGVAIDAPVTIVVHPQSNAAADRELNAIRTQFGNVVVSMHDAARTLVKALTTGGTVAFLVDQHANAEKDPWIEFFGRTTPTYEAPAALALRFQVPIFYAFAQRMDDGSYVAPLKRLPMEDLDNSGESVRELTRRHVKVLEEAIRRHPNHWSWQHRRWRYDEPQTRQENDDTPETTG
jgi:Kdo2-lipid IVA lauroyltransferase/acyltransferase